MEDDGGERSSFVIGLIENRAKEVPLFCLSHLYIIFRENAGMERKIKIC